MHDLSLKGVDGTKKAFTYILPQINSQASVAMGSWKTADSSWGTSRWTWQPSTPSRQSILWGRAPHQSYGQDCFDPSRNGSKTTTSSTTVCWHQLSPSRWTKLLLLEGCQTAWLREDPMARAGTSCAEGGGQLKSRGVTPYLDLTFTRMRMMMRMAECKNLQCRGRDWLLEPAIIWLDFWMTTGLLQ